MKKIGLIGESTNDTQAIRNLLQRQYKGIYSILISRAKGDQLKSTKYARQVKFELEKKECHIYIYVRDLDIDANLSSRAAEFAEINILKGQVLFLLNIYEIEALILSDIKTFNKIYKVNFSFSGDPMKEQTPKKLLITKTDKSKKQYDETHCPEIFKKLNFDTVLAKCSYFRKFISDFEKLIA